MILFFVICLIFYTTPVSAYPIFAQNNYSNPREATGRIVCANCHLASKPRLLETPQSIFPGEVFSVRAKIPRGNAKQVTASGKPGNLNIGGVLILPEGFTLAPRELIPSELLKQANPKSYQVYNKENPNILVFGPVAAKKEIVFPILAPEKSNFGRVNFYFGGNRGRGQVYPNGQKSNNRVYTTPIKGTISEIRSDKVVINSPTGSPVEIIIPKGPEIIVQKNQEVSVDQPLRTNPNVGGFGQIEREVVIQAPSRLVAIQIFLWTITVSQIVLILKKKQIEIVGV